MITVLSLLGGLALLIGGGEFLVRGAVQVADRFGVSPLVIGLTLVGFGTSTPELVTSVQAALIGSPGIAYGNIVGSNIANVLLILGVSAILYPIVVTSAGLRRDGLVMVAVAVAFALLAAVVPLGAVAGAAFLAALGAYLWMVIRQERAAQGANSGAIHDKSLALQQADPALQAARSGPLLRALGTAVGGLLLVIAGGHFLVDGAVALAKIFGVPDSVIGLTIVAVGTSMPELVTSVVAALRHQSDVAFGNVVGSNIYNILGIGGVTALVAPGRVPPEIVAFDALVMVAVSLAMVVVAYTGLRIRRWEGALLLAGFATYIAFVWPVA